MSHKFACAALFCALISSAPVANATTYLAGDTVSVKVALDGIELTYDVNVGDGVDLQSPQFAFDGQLLDLNAGVDGDLFTLSSTTEVGGLTPILGTRIQWTLSGLDFAASSLMNFIVTQADVAEFTIEELTASSVTFSYNDGPLPQGTYFSARFDTTALSEAPIPGALPLFASVLGLGGLLTYRRQRKMAQAYP